MIQTENICKELMTNGLNNIVKQEYNKQWEDGYPKSFSITSLKEIHHFLDKMCVLEPIPTKITNEDMFRVTHIIARSKTEEDVIDESLDLDKLKKYKTDIYLDEQGYYNIVINEELVSHKVNTCPPASFSIICKMWDSVNKRASFRDFELFRKTIEKEILM